MTILKKNNTDGSTTPRSKTRPVKDKISERSSEHSNDAAKKTKFFISNYMVEKIFEDISE